MWQNILRTQCAQVMHQQYTETLTWGLIAEPGRSLLAAAAQDAGRGGGACVALHGLHPDMGMLSPKARLPLPPLGAAQGTTPAPPPTQHSQVGLFECFPSETSPPCKANSPPLECMHGHYAVHARALRMQKLIV
jgi:hypothetical protein